MSELSEALIAFVRKDLLKGRDVAIGTDTYLFETGLVDSLGILRLIAFLELQIGRSLDDREVVMEHFRTIDAIVRHFATRDAHG